MYITKLIGNNLIEWKQVNSKKKCILNKREQEYRDSGHEESNRSKKNH